MKKPTRWMYSTEIDAEHYHGNFESRQAAIMAAKMAIIASRLVGERDLTYIEKIHIGKRISPLDAIRTEVNTQWTGDTAFEYVQELTEEVCYHERRPVIEMTHEKQKALGIVILDFVKKNAKVNMYSVTDVEVVEVGI